MGGTRGNRGQVATLFETEVFSSSPVLLVGVPQEAVVPNLLPGLFAGFDALVATAS